MRRFKISITAGQLHPLAIAGDYIRVISSAGELGIQPDTSHALQGMQAGMSYTAPKSFKQLNITSDITQTIEIMAGIGRVDDNRTSISGTVDAAGKGATVASASVTVGTSATALVTANANRRGLIIQNLDASADIYIGGAAVATTDGLKVPADGSLTLDKAPQGAIYAIASAAGVDVRVFTESD